MSRNIRHSTPWTAQEDALLLSGISKYGLQRWEKIASLLQGSINHSSHNNSSRTAMQCRDRFQHYLDPRLNLDEESFTAEEEQRLLEGGRLFPQQWNLIAEHVNYSNYKDNNNNNNKEKKGYLRPAWLCEKHYQRLLDELDYYKSQRQNNNNNNKEAITLEDFLRLREEKRKSSLSSSSQLQNNNNNNNNNYSKTVAGVAPVGPSYEEQAAVSHSGNNNNNNGEESEMIRLAVSRLANQDQKKGLRKERTNKKKQSQFLAALENNREAIESDTLSGRQRKKYERALQEDEITKTLLQQQHHEGNDEDDEEDEMDGFSGNDDEDNNEVLPNHNNSNNNKIKDGFTPMEVTQLEKRSGNEKKQRRITLDDSNFGLSTNATDTTRLLDNKTAINFDFLDQIESHNNNKTINNNTATTALRWNDLAQAPSMDENVSVKEMLDNLLPSLDETETRKNNTAPSSPLRPLSPHKEQENNNNINNNNNNNTPEKVSVLKRPREEIISPLNHRETMAKIEPHSSTSLQQHHHHHHHNNNNIVSSKSDLTSSVTFYLKENNNKSNNKNNKDTKDYYLKRAKQAVSIETEKRMHYRKIPETHKKDNNNNNNNKEEDNAIQIIKSILQQHIQEEKKKQQTYNNNNNNTNNGDEDGFGGEGRGGVSCPPRRYKGVSAVDSTALLEKKIRHQLSEIQSRLNKDYSTMENFLSILFSSDLPSSHAASSSGEEGNDNNNNNGFCEVKNSIPYYFSPRNLHHGNNNNNNNNNSNDLIWLPQLLQRWTSVVHRKENELLFLEDLMTKEQRIKHKRGIRALERDLALLTVEEKYWQSLYKNTIS